MNRNMNDDHTQKAIVITGASTGIGEAAAREFDRLGYRVFAGVRSDDAADRLRNGTSKRLTPVRMDVTNADSLRAAAVEIDTATGEAGVHAVLCNAGLVVASPWELVPIDDLRALFEVNVFGVAATLQSFLPALRRAAKQSTDQYTSRIVITGSVSGRCTPAYIGPYSASKHALEAMADALRIELRHWRIGISLLEPGAVSTPIWGKAHSTTRDRLDRPDVAPRVSLYDADIDQVFLATSDARDNGMAVDEITRRMVHAVTATTPKTRYPIGRHIGLAIRLRRWLPDRLWDRILKREMGLK